MLKVGDVIQTKKIRALIQEGSGYMEFVHPDKNKSFLVLFLGEDDIKNPTLSVNEELNKLGWKFVGDEDATI